MKRYLLAIIGFLLLASQAWAAPPCAPTPAASTTKAGKVEIATDAEQATGESDAVVSTPGTVAAVYMYDTIWVPAAAFHSCTTSGATKGQYEFGTNDIDVVYYAFDGGATEERVQFAFPMPENWDRSSIKAKFFWSSATGSTAGDTCEFGLKAGALADNDAVDTALGTAATISDTLLANSGADMQISSATGAITVAGTPALGEFVVFEVYRNTDGTDDMAEDAWLFGCWIQYKRNNTVATW